MQNNGPLKVGFIGAGKRARGAHYPVISKLQNVSILAVAEMDETPMNEVAEQYSIPQTFLCKSDSDYQRMLDKVDLDVVSTANLRNGETYFRALCPRVRGEDEILLNRERFHEAWLLMYHSDPGGEGFAWRLELLCSPFNFDGA